MLFEQNKQEDEEEGERTRQVVVEQDSNKQIYKSSVTPPFPMKLGSDDGAQPSCITAPNQSGMALPLKQCANR